MTSLAFRIPSSLLVITLIFSVTQVAAQEGPGIVIARPGQDVELLCTVAVNASETKAGWLVNHMGPFGVNALRNDILTGHSAALNSNNLIVENIMMNDGRNGSDYRCVIIIQNTSIQDILRESDPTLLYVAGVPAMVPDVMAVENINGNNVILSWGEPFNNLDPIVNYIVSCSGDVTCPPNFTTTDNTTRSYTITNLNPMTDYTFSVVATNSIGSGEPGVVMITTPQGEPTTSVDSMTFASTESVIATTSSMGMTTTTTSSVGMPTTTSSVGMPTTTSSVGMTTTTSNVGMPTTTSSVGMPTTATTSSVGMTTTATTSSVGMTTTTTSSVSMTTTTSVGMTTTTSVGMTTATSSVGMTTTRSSVGMTTTISSMGMTTTTTSSMGMTTTTSSVGMTTTTSSVGLTTTTSSMGMPTATTTSSVGMTTTTSSMGITIATSSMGMTTATSSVGMNTITSSEGMTTTTITTSSVDMTTATTTTSSSESNNNEIIPIVIIVLIVVMILCCCGCMCFVFCCCYTRKEWHQDKELYNEEPWSSFATLIILGVFTFGISILIWYIYLKLQSSKNGEDKYCKITNVSIFVLGIYTCGTSVLLWWMYKGITDCCSSKDKQDLEDKSAIPLSSSETKSIKKPKGNEVPSISNKLIAEEADELTTRYQTSPRQLPNVVSAADRGAVVNETHVDQSILGYAVVDIQDVIARKNVAPSVQQGFEPTGQYALPNETADKSENKGIKYAELQELPTSGKIRTMANDTFTPYAEIC